MLDDTGLQRVLGQLRMARQMEWPRLWNIRRYMLNEADLGLYVPDEASKEYQELVDQARFNVLPLVVGAKAQRLYVDGYRPTTESGRPAAENSPIWDSAWQANRMDARQAGLYRAAITYGYSFATVLPGRILARGGDGQEIEQDAPVITPWSPLRCTTIYEDPVNDQWPRYAMTLSLENMFTGKAADVTALSSSIYGPLTIRVYDETHVYTMHHDPIRQATETERADEHGLGVCPVVRYLDQWDLDGCSFGKVEPLLPLQRQINQTTFGLLMAQHYAAFRQRWATGMLIERNEDGTPRAPWVAAVNRVWQNESPDGKFGDFEETDLSGYLNSRREQLLFVTALSQLPPHNVVVGDSISNIAAEALVALEASNEHDINEYQTSLGESHEQLFRLCGRATNDNDTWTDRSAQVHWRDTQPRSLAQVADALGKLATQLEIPVQALWERIPDTTDQDLARWQQLAEEARQSNQIRQMLVDELTAPQAQPPVAPDGPGPEEGQEEEQVAVGAGAPAPG